MKFLLCLFLGLASLYSYGLEIDERLTMRIVKVSASKKTILINRGVEDGIIKGDHAKFFLTIGVVARGVVVKVSPTRSVWSLYRLVNADYIRDDQVMRLKITAPVKITKDESKMLVADDTVVALGSKDPRDLGIPIAEGADDDTAEGKLGLDGEVKDLSEGFEAQAISLREKNKEFFATFHYSGQSNVASPSNDGDEVKGDTTLLVLNTGIEIYIKNLKKWYSRFSLVGELNLTRMGATSYKGDSIQESITEFGGGVNWYPFTRPTKVYRIIPFGSFRFLLGSISSKFTPGSGTTPSTDKDGEGATLGYKFGGGIKYFTPRGYGAKFSFDYTLRGDTFAEDDDGVKWTKNNTGPVMSMGFLYRF